ncbi:AAA family ATPase [Verrucomicrobiaceae bacterium 5K15]|uniref:AAA family ATPase n=1 Tax=Oceaniferula flava TaxID=2800421 RepID=A0AAE2V8B8_9BACT|nr:AAA family ATPase [Oceaniferula flavus]MBK1855327.1 AAA family ATPase [Oceaniferula flavus]MBM1136633.1 AAA family ATPase [Oceaniferula flavus]
MDINKIVIRDVSFLGNGRDSASIKFQSGLNVLCGASETGKSFLVEAIDYLLGGGKLRDIPERVGYDRVRIGIEIVNEGSWTFERSVDGGGYTQYEGIIGEEVVAECYGNLKVKHTSGKVDNLSGWMLDKINLLNKRLKKNKSGGTRSLSFRDLARLVIVNEKEIIRHDSPFLSGQVVTKTAEYSALKLLLTGADDSAVVAIEKNETAETGLNAKIELLDQWIQDSEDEVADYGATRREITSQLVKLENAIVSQRDYLGEIQSQLNESMRRRREVVKRREIARDRLDEITDLLERFSLLRAHYAVDINRLMAIEESGSLFVHHAKVTCPLCGAPPEAGHDDGACDGACDGDVASIVQAASAEIEKIKALASDLEATITSLLGESDRLKQLLKGIDISFGSIDQSIRETMAPDLSIMQQQYSEFLEKKNEVHDALNAVKRLDKLKLQKEELLKNEGDDVSEDDGTGAELSKHVLNQLSQTVQNILQAWDFPDAENVYFDEKEKDFVISGKPRGSRGKGLRAITHAAVTLGLLEFCQKYSLPHPGFVVMDSPLLAYYAPEGEEDNLQGSALKHNFYRYLLDNHAENQIIIIENQHPPEEFADKLNLIVFTKNPQEGRFGLFPIETETI